MKGNLFEIKLIFQEDLERHFEHSSYVLKKVADYGQVDILKWIVSNYKNDINIHANDEYVFRHLILTEDLDALKWLISEYPNINLYAMNKYAFLNAALIKNIDILKWLFELIDYDQSIFEIGYVGNYKDELLEIIPKKGTIKNDDSLDQRSMKSKISEDITEYLIGIEDYDMRHNLYGLIKDKNIEGLIKYFTNDSIARLMTKKTEFTMFWLYNMSEYIITIDDKDTRIKILDFIRDEDIKGLIEHFTNEQVASYIME